MATQLKNVSILTIGEAKGHNLYVDETSLQEALTVAQSMGRIKVTNGHGATQVMDILGYVENFKIEGQRLLGDLTLLDSEKANYVRSLAETMPDQFGLSITFSGMPREIDGRRFASVTEIYDVSVVVTPAANASLFTAFSALPVDRLQQAMDSKNPAVEAKLEAAAEAPVTPAAPVFNAEEAIAALAAKIETLSQQFADLVTAKLEAAVVEAAPADEAPMAEPAPEPVAAEAKVEETVVDAPADNTAAALKAELATLKIELEASRGTKPLETSAPQNFSRAELIAQFNAEKDPRRAAEIFKQIKLAR
jgi:hypothetical protein